MVDDKKDWGPKPFKFFNAWLTIPNCLKIMEASWSETMNHKWAAYRLINKLKRMKDLLKAWANEEFGDLQRKIERIEGDLHNLDTKAEVEVLSEEERGTRRNLKDEMWRLSRLNEWMWMQKSRVNWYLNGDKNSKFFHSMAVSRQRRNCLVMPEIDSVIVEDKDLIREGVLNFYKNLYVEDWECRPMFSEEEEGETISSEMASLLIGPFT